jgi:hypothetical protein
MHAPACMRPFLRCSSGLSWPPGQLEQVRAQELDVLRCQEDDEDYRLAMEKLEERLEAYTQEHGIPEHSPAQLADAVQTLRWELMERAPGRL